MFASVIKKAVTGIANLSFLRKYMETRGFEKIANRFIAGKTLDDALLHVLKLEQQKKETTLDLLGESVFHPSEAIQAKDDILEMLNTLQTTGSPSHVSIKLTQLGLLIDESMCLNHVRMILDVAKKQCRFVRIDMEDSAVTDATLRVFHRAHEEYGPKTVGIVIQSYLYRTGIDVELLMGMGANVRVVKGAYLEPKSVAYPKKDDVDDAYFDLVVKLLDAGNYVGIATHDRKMIEMIKQVIRDHEIRKDQFEFQLLYGIATGLQDELVREGYRVRIYTPFGKEWYPYFTRRLAERPANLMFVLKHL